jgi:hypothetical protein
MLVQNDAPAAVVDVVVLIPDIAFSFAFSLFSFFMDFLVLNIYMRLIIVLVIVRLRKQEASVLVD